MARRGRKPIALQVPFLADQGLEVPERGRFDDEAAIEPPTPAPMITILESLGQEAQKNEAGGEDPVTSSSLSDVQLEKKQSSGKADVDVQRTGAADPGEEPPSKRVKSVSVKKARIGESSSSKVRRVYEKHLQAETMDGYSDAADSDAEEENLTVEVKLLTYPRDSAMETEFTEAELLAVDQIAERHELKRLERMGVIKKAEMVTEPMENVSLSAKFVKT